MFIDEVDFVRDICPKIKDKEEFYAKLYSVFKSKKAQYVIINIADREIDVADYSTYIAEMVVRAASGLFIRLNAKLKKVPKDTAFKFRFVESSNGTGYRLKLQVNIKETSWIKKMVDWIKSHLLLR